MTSQLSNANKTPNVHSNFRFLELIRAPLACGGHAAKKLNGRRFNLPSKIKCSDETIRPKQSFCTI